MAAQGGDVGFLDFVCVDMIGAGSFICLTSPGDVGMCSIAYM